MKHFSSSVVRLFLFLFVLCLNPHAARAIDELGDDELSGVELEMGQMEDFDLDSLGDGVDSGADDELLAQADESPEVVEPVAPGVVPAAEDLEALLKKVGMGQEEVMKMGWGKILPAFASAAKGGLDREKAAIKARDAKLKEMDERLQKVNKGITGARQLLARYQARFRQYTERGDEPETDAERRQIFFGGALLEDLAGKDAKIEARYQDAMRRIADMEANMAAVMWRTFDYTAELLKIMNQRLMILEEKMGSTMVSQEEAMQAGGEELQGAVEENITSAGDVDDETLLVDEELGDE
ncbi:MAG: hypothetical protein PVJ92_00100 [Candidatus Dependentiae bacterium]|jgi:hypothetical protein